MVQPRSVTRVIHPANEIGRIIFNNNMLMMQETIRGGEFNSFYNGSSKKKPKGISIMISIYIYILHISSRIYVNFGEWNKIGFKFFIFTYSFIFSLSPFPPFLYDKLLLCSIFLPHLSFFSFLPYKVFLINLLSFENPYEIYNIIRQETEKLRSFNNLC